MPAPFVHDQASTRVVFGPGTLGVLADELARLPVHRALVVPDEAMDAVARELAGTLGERCVGTLGQVRRHVPGELAEHARARAAELGADGIVALGGGSATGLAKAVAAGTGLPIVAIPTTYAGSEMTPVYGITDGDTKRTARDVAVQPRTVVYDPELSRGLPLAVSAASAMNAMAHCVDAVWGTGAGPITDLLAAEGAQALRRGLAGIGQRPDDLDARGELLYGACLSGWVFAAAGGALHHTVCHVLGGAFDLPHAETHSAVLPHAAAHNAAHAVAGQRRLAAALGVDELAGGLFDIATQIGAPTALGDLGMTGEQVATATELVLERHPVNPVPVTRDGIALLLRSAFAGVRPTAAVPEPGRAPGAGGYARG